jgi:hypothetical protein
MEGRYEILKPLDQPAIVMNDFGKGRSLFFAGTFGEMCYTHNPFEYRAVLSNAVRLLSSVPVELEGHVGNVEVVVRKQGQRVLVHLVNYAGLFPRPFEGLAPQRDFQVRLPALDREPAAVRALMGGTDCPFRHGEDGTVIDVPLLNDYEVIAVE